MFNIYAVRYIDGQKHRFFLGGRDTLDEAKHLANCATCGNASYAYVKDMQGSTLFYLEEVNPRQYEAPKGTAIRQPRPPSQP